MWQQTPSTPATHDVEDGVKELTQSVDSWPSASFWGRDIRLYASPLGIGEVGWVSLSHACQGSEPLPNTPFSDGLSTTFGE